MNLQKIIREETNKSYRKWQKDVQKNTGFNIKDYEKQIFSNGFTQGYFFALREMKKEVILNE